MNHKKLLIIAAVLSLTGLTLAAQQTEPGQPRTIRVAEGVSAKSLVHCVAPEYPETARDKRIIGTVVVSFRIDTQGSVNQTEVVSGHPLFRDAALDAVKQWRFQPYLLNGEPVQVQTTTTLQIEPNPGDQRIHLSQAQVETNLTHRVAPAYPQIAKEAHIEGDVILSAEIDRNGNVTSVRAVSGHPLLIQPALDAAREWHYEPFISNCKPVEVEAVVKVHFPPVSTN